MTAVGYKYKELLSVLYFSLGKAFFVVAKQTLRVCFKNNLNGYYYY